MQHPGQRQKPARPVQYGPISRGFWPGLSGRLFPRGVKILYPYFPVKYKSQFSHHEFHLIEVTIEERAGIQISQKAFVQSVLILFVLMMVAGILTRVVPVGSYARTIQGGREVIVPQSFQAIVHPDYPIWRWFTAPLRPSPDRMG